MPQRLVARVMFDPELAMHLLTRDASGGGTPGWNGKLLRLPADAAIRCGTEMARRSGRNGAG